MIELHEDEYLDSAVDDEMLLLVLDVLGLKAKDKLLYKKEDALCSISSSSSMKSVTSR